jgi:hypothetical protein
VKRLFPVVGWWRKRRCLAGRHRGLDDRRSGLGGSGDENWLENQRGHRLIRPSPDLHETPTRPFLRVVDLAEEGQGLGRLEVV